MTSKRNVDVNVNVNLNVNLEHVLDADYKGDIRTYACTDLRSLQNAMCPTFAFRRGGVRGGWGHKNQWKIILGVRFFSGKKKNQHFCKSVYVVSWMDGHAGILTDSQIQSLSHSVMQCTIWLIN